MTKEVKVVLVTGAVASLFGAIMLIPARSDVGSRSVRTEVLDPWPLTVPWVWLRCNPGGYLGARRVFVTTPDGTRYAANGSARSEAPLTTPIEADPNTNALIFRGLALCDNGLEPMILRKR